MKDDVASKEKLSGPQLAVQSYLNELLQEATVEFEEPVIEEPSLSPLEILQQAESAVDINNAYDGQIEALSPQQELQTSESEVQEASQEKLELSVEDSEQTKIELPASIEEFDRVTPSITEPEIASPPEKESEILETKQVDVSKPVELVEVEPEAEKEAELPWSESRFECLLFNVGGLKMAVPLVELGSIQKADSSTITSIFGQPDWFIGISSVSDLRIRTVDTAKWVMPNHYKGELTKEFQFIIQLDRSNWGLACEEVAEAITLEPSEVKWRADRTKRPWLAGTVIKHMCAILDVQGFINLLDDPKNGFNPSTIK